MSDQIQSTIDSKSLIAKLKANLERVNTRLANSKNTSITSALSEANASLKLFFDTLQDPIFYPKFLETGDTARSEVYNENLKAIDQDLDRFYQELASISNAQIKTYNFSRIVTDEITRRANALASIVLDLNILNGYDKGDTIIAGDDFKNNDYVDQNFAVTSTPAEATSNGYGMGLARNGSNNVLGGAKIDVMPLAPNNGTSVNLQPTAGNIERFYEGNYYNFIGAARPEGGQFNIKYINTAQEGATTSGNYTEPSGIFVEMGAPKEEKLAGRASMVDGSPVTFWECEYLFRVPDQLFDFPEAIVVDNEASATNQVGGTVSVDMDEIDKIAQTYDTDTKDLVVDLIITLPSVTSINFVSLNPVIFGSNSFPEVEDIATASTTDGDFSTVDGWHNLRFAKTLTPEANEFLTDSQVAASFSPNRNNYIGQGVYPFPVREAKKLKIRLRSRKPVACPYERTFILVKRQVDITAKTTVTTTKGRLSF